MAAHNAVFYRGPFARVSKAGQSQDPHYVYLYIQIYFTRMSHSICLLQLQTPFPIPLLSKSNRIDNILSSHYNLVHLLTGVHSGQTKTVQPYMQHQRNV